MPDRKKHVVSISKELHRDIKIQAVKDGVHAYEVVEKAFYEKYGRGKNVG